MSWMRSTLGGVCLLLSVPALAAESVPKKPAPVVRKRSPQVRERQSGPHEEMLRSTLGAFLDPCQVPSTALTTPCPPPPPKPRLKQSKITVQGGLNENAVKRVIQRHQGEVVYCYGKELLRAPGLQGHLEVTFTVDEHGSTQDVVSKQSSLHNEQVESCVVEYVRRWNYPVMEGPTIVQWSLDFDSQ